MARSMEKAAANPNGAMNGFMGVQMGMNAFGSSFASASASNQQQMQQQIMKMQEDMQKAQQEVEEKTFSASVGGGVVSAEVNGKKEVTNITIKPEAVDPDDIEMLEDLVAAAVNATVKQVDETAEAEMGKLTGGMNIPGL